MKFKIYSLSELVEIARTRSPYYRELYAKTGVKPADASIKITSLPVIDQTDFWRANSLIDNQLLTQKVTDGIVFKSGGTTGSPKFSVFSREEWETFTEVFGQGLTAGGLSSGERIANYFYGGALYASFLFIYKSLEHAATSTVQLPIAGGTDPLDALHMMEDFEVGTIAGVPTGVMAIAQTYAAKKQDFPRLAIKKILFGGESMHDDQRRLLGDIFPGVHIASIGYASVDAGLLGYADSSCRPDEHRVFGDASIIEIIDEATGEVIEKTGKAGRVLITNLTRSLMPIIRYPAGDRAEWMDDPQKTKSPRFRLLGRSEEAARVGPVSLYYNDIDDLITPFKEKLEIRAFQMEIFHHDEKDGLILRVAVPAPSRVQSRDTNAILDALFQQRPMLREWAISGKVHMTTIQWVNPYEIVVNNRTGKLRRIIDRRY